jgi:exonuclease SbcD
MSRDKLKRGELEMFKDFFVQITGNEVTDEQDKAIQDTIKELYLEEKNA